MYEVQVSIKGIGRGIIFNQFPLADPSKDTKAKAKKTEDDTDSMIYWCDDRTIGIPGDNIEACLRVASKQFKDPRSSKRMLEGLWKSSVSVRDEMHSTGLKEYTVLAKRAVPQSGKGAITRRRPMLKAGWEVSFVVVVNQPDFIKPKTLRDVLEEAGRFVGLCDWRPKYGLFEVTEFKEL